MGDPNTPAAVVDERAAIEAEPSPGRRPLGALEVRRRVEGLFHRELAEPSEDFVRFVSSRLGLDAACGGEQAHRMCRAALREMGRDERRRAAPAGLRRDSDRRQLDRRRFEQHRELPGYYLG